MSFYRFLVSSILVTTSLALAACSKKEQAEGSDQQNVPATTRECPADRSARCVEVQQKIAELEVSQRQAADDGDTNAMARSGLDLNHQRELLSLLFNANTSQEAFDALESKYEELATVLERELARLTRPEDPAVDPVKTERIAALVYHEREVNAVTSVMDDFGALYIAESPLDAMGKPAYQEVQVPQPWAGYWYPFRGNDLFGNDSSPLRKLDRAMHASGSATTSAETERRHRDLFYADSWEGLCSAWAVAATVSPEPKRDLVAHGVTFSVSDQKALLTKAYERYPTKTYGVRYNGDAETDGTIQDLRPEAFHRLFLSLLGEKKLPFVIDDESGIEVWSKPVYRVRWSVSKDPEVPNAYYVKALPWMTRHRSDITTAPTTSADIAAPVYEYRLYVDPKISLDGKFKVIAGEWLGDSLDSHPDSVLIAAPGGDLKSGNEEINKGLSVIKEIIESAR